MESHYRAAMNRPSARAAIEIRTPSQTDDGWTAGGATVVQIVTDDRPFLVDSVTMEVLRQGWSIREVFHPQFLVRRDLGGTLHGIVHRPGRGQGRLRRCMPESWMHLEILPPSGRTDAEPLARPDARAGTARGAAAGRGGGRGLAEDDHPAEETVELLERARPRPPVGRRRPAQAGELLDWLNDNHFTFLGYREYRPRPARAAEPAYEPVPATGLGILRADGTRRTPFHALPQPGRGPRLMVITKDNHKSRVHRPAYLDYLGFRLFDADGPVVGERRFLGLFSSIGLLRGVARVPVLRQKAAAVLRRSGYDEHSHGGKAIMDVLETYPRDELFQTPVDELATDRGEGRPPQGAPPGPAVRPARSVRALPVLPGLPAARPLHHRGAQPDAGHPAANGSAARSIDYTARVTESVLARLHFVLRMPVGQALGEVDVRALERELTLGHPVLERRVRRPAGRGADDLADAARRQLGAARCPRATRRTTPRSRRLKDLAALTELPSARDMAMAMFVPDRRRRRGRPAAQDLPPRRRRCRCRRCCRT